MPLPYGVTLDRRVARTTMEDVTREVSLPGRVINLADYSEDWTLYFLNQFSAYQEIATQSSVVSSWLDDVARLVVAGSNLPGPDEVPIGDLLLIEVNGWGALTLTVSNAQNAGGVISSTYEISAAMADGDQSVALPDPAPGTITYPPTIGEQTTEETVTKHYWAGRRDFAARDVVQVGANGIFEAGDVKFYIRGGDRAAFPISALSGVGTFLDPLTGQSYQVKGTSEIDRGQYVELLCRGG